MKPILTAIPLAFVSCVLPVLATAQSTAEPDTADPNTQPPAEAAAEQDLTQKIVWPAQKDRVVCVIDGHPHTIAQVVAYLEKNHWPGLSNFLDLPAGQLYFESPYPPRWVRQYADIMALRAEAKLMGISEADAKPFLEESLRLGFGRWLDQYTAARAQEGEVSPTFSQEKLNTLLSHFQNEFGLETELGGWLAAMVPPTPKEADGKLRDYYADHARYFGGVTTIAQIMVRNRDPITGELFVGDKRRAAIKRVEEIKDRLASDASNFEELAKLYSEENITAARGGILRNIKRFDPRLPALLCRTAWTTKDGEVTGPIESSFGVHFIKRLSYAQPTFILYTEQIVPEIIATKRQHEQEDLLFATREKRSVELRY